MNRIAPAASKIAMKSAVTTHKHSQTLVNRTRRFVPSQDDLAYATFAPIHYEKRYAYPLLVWLSPQRRAVMRGQLAENSNAQAHPDPADDPGIHPECAR